MSSFVTLCALLLVSASARAGDSTSTVTESGTSTETSTWKRVDKSLTDGVRTAKKKFLDADDGSEKPKAKAKTDDSNGHELDKVTDSLNQAWDSVVHGAGKILKTQQTSTTTATEKSTK